MEMIDKEPKEIKKTKPKVRRSKLNSKKKPNGLNGRPKGATTKIRLADLLFELENTLGVPYPTQLALNYSGAIQRSDWKCVHDYDRLFLNKVVADKQEVTTVPNEDEIESKAKIFADALTKLAKRDND